MANTKILLRGLEEYHKTLTQHLRQLQQEFSSMESQWRAFSAVYEGDAADQFRSHWQRTTARFQEYIDQGQSIAKVLDERIIALRAANKQEGLF